MRSVVLSPADADEHATPRTSRNPKAPLRSIFAGRTRLLRVIVEVSPAEVRRDLFCQRRFLLLALAVVACTDPSAPGAISARFELTDVDGQILPATSAPGIGTPGSTIVSGTMSLDLAGGAFISEDRIDSGGTQHTVSSNYLYTIKGSTIEFDYPQPCPSTALCPRLPTGQVLNNGLGVEVDFGIPSPFQVYTFRTLTQ